MNQGGYPASFSRATPGLLGERKMPGAIAWKTSDRTALPYWSLQIARAGEEPRGLSPLYRAINITFCRSSSTLCRFTGVHSRLGRRTGRAFALTEVTTLSFDHPPFSRSPFLVDVFHSPARSIVGGWKRKARRSLAQTLRNPKYKCASGNSLLTAYMLTIILWR